MLAQTPIPSVEGQPAWVVVLVALLSVIGLFGVTYLTTKWKRPAEKGDTATVTSTSVEPNAITVIQAAMEHLAEVARRESEQNEGAQREIRKLRGQLERSEQAVRNAETALEECHRHARDLARRAWRDDDSSGPK